MEYTFKGKYTDFWRIIRYTYFLLVETDPLSDKIIYRLTVSTYAEDVIQWHNTDSYIFSYQTSFFQNVAQLFAAAVQDYMGYWWECSASTDITQTLSSNDVGKCKQ